MAPVLRCRFLLRPAGRIQDDMTNMSSLNATNRTHQRDLPQRASSAGFITYPRKFSDLSALELPNGVGSLAYLIASWRPATSSLPASGQAIMGSQMIVATASSAGSCRRSPFSRGIRRHSWRRRANERPRSGLNRKTADPNRLPRTRVGAEKMPSRSTGMPRSIWQRLMP